jgi:transposase
MPPLEGMMKALGTPNITPELKQMVINGVMREAAGRSVDQLAQEEKLGHTVRLMPPAYVKPHVKRQKNDVATSWRSSRKCRRASLVACSSRDQ